jgi:hypothetical protein
LGGSGRKLFISTSFGVSFPFGADVEPEDWPGLGPRDSAGAGLADISVGSVVSVISVESIVGIGCC